MRHLHYLHQQKAFANRKKQSCEKEKIVEDPTPVYTVSALTGAAAALVSRAFSVHTASSEGSGFPKLLDGLQKMMEERPTGRITVRCSQQQPQDLAIKAVPGSGFPCRPLGDFLELWIWHLAKAWFPVLHRCSGWKSAAGYTALNLGNVGQRTLWLCEGSTKRMVH